jgi:hypothetical protein
LKRLISNIKRFIGSLPFRIDSPFNILKMIKGDEKIWISIENVQHAVIVVADVKTKNAQSVGTVIANANLNNHRM